jgi:hypothetical protein
MFWTWKVQRGKPGRPPVAKDTRDLIRKMSRENPLWGAPRIHGELLKLGIDIGETSVSKYLIRHREPPSQTWRTFLDNQVKAMVSVVFTVPTIRFQVRYVFLVLAHERRCIVHFNVTAHEMTGLESGLTYEETDSLRPCRRCAGRRSWLGDQFWQCVECIPTDVKGKIWIELTDRTEKVLCAS